MSCEISLGRLEGCKDQIGGLNAIYFVNFGDAESWTTADEAITAIGASVAPSAYKYDLRGNSSFDQSLTSSRENGTTFYESTLNATFQVLDVATQEEIKLLNRGRAQYVAELYPNGAGVTKYLLIGKDNGAEITGGTIVSGAAAGDLQGFTLTAVAMEVNPPFFCTVPDVSATASIDPA